MAENNSEKIHKDGGDILTVVIDILTMSGRNHKSGHGDP